MAAIWGALSMARETNLGDAGAMQRNSTRLKVLLRRLAGPKYPLPMPSGRLAHCERCDSDFVNPVSWHELGDTSWWIRLRCGECGAVREVEVSDEEAKRFDDELDRGLQKIVATVARLERERMIAYTNALTVALERDLIDPGDFCR
jgi:hypothetical protein